jgi:xylulokinase
VWNQIKADVLNVPVQRLGRPEFATWGSAMIAGHAIGLFPDLAATALQSAERAGAPSLPQPEAVSLYRPLTAAALRWSATLAAAFRAEGTPS